MTASVVEPVVARLRAAGCVFAEDEARLLVDAAASPAELAELVHRRVSGLPLEHILGWVAFCGLRIAVAPGVFVPRARTELLVRVAAERTARHAVVLDLCCGCGALGVALAALVGAVELHASDVDPVAVRCAAGNVGGLGSVYCGDLFAALPPSLRGRIDTLLVNAPYVPADALATMPPEAREHEPRVALDGGADGLAVLRRVVTEAPGWLAPGGQLCTETSAAQAPVLSEFLSHNGFTPEVVSDDDIGGTAVIGRYPGAVTG